MTAAGHASSRYVVISTDGHCGADLWDYKPYLESRYHDEFDAWANAYADGWAEVDVASGERRVGAASFSSTYNWDSTKRLEQTELEGIAAEILFPNTSPPFYPSGSITAPGPRSAKEYELRFAGIKAHNRWLVDFCSQAPGRRAGIAQLFLNDVDAAVAEARWAREHGLMGVLLPADHLLHLANLYYPEYDALWAACVDLDMPVIRHGVICAESADRAGIGAPAVGLFEAYYFAQRGIDHMILAGVFERFPTLKFVLSEVNAAWAVDFGQRLDAFVLGSKTPGTILHMFAADAAGALSLTPSEYIRRNCYFGTFFDSSDIAARHEVGIDRMMWGADFPHHEGTSPYTREALRVNFAGLPEAEVRQMTSLTAAECYGFDLDHLQKVADRIGPSVEEVATPLGREEFPSYPEQTVCATFAGGWNGNEY